MIRKIAFAAVALTACAASHRPNFGTLSHAERPFTFQHDAQLLHLTNGLEVALVHDDRTNIVTVDVRYAVGAAEDPAGRAGLAHLVEHLLFELRAAPGEPTLGETLGELALYSNASTTWDATHFTTHVGPEHLVEAFALEARRMDARCDELDDETFLRERDVPFDPSKVKAQLADAFGGIHRRASAPLVGMVASGAALVSTMSECRAHADNDCAGRVGSKRNALYAAFGGSLTVTAIAVFAGRGAPSNDELRAIAARYNQVTVAPRVTNEGAAVTVGGHF